MYIPQTTENKVVDRNGVVVGYDFPVLADQSAKELAAMFPDLISGVIDGPPNFRGNPIFKPLIAKVPYFALNNGTSVMAWYIAEYFQLGWWNAPAVARQQLQMTIDGM